MKGNKNKNFKRTILSLMVAIVVFVGLLVLESKLTTPNGLATVVRATEDIPEGTVIKKEMLNRFEEVEVDGKLDFEKVLRSKDELLDQKTEVNLYKGEIVSDERLTNIDDVLGAIENKVETSIKVADMSQIVGGILREGDMIDISIVNGTTSENEKVLEKVYVDKAFSSEAKELKREEDYSAMAINVIISKEDEAKLNKALELGTVRISKVK